jgi:intracellular sulfur oxidation DsrE/DsrF family protein
MAKTISVIESAYRATIEEQDDTIVWVNHAMKGAGADLAVLLRGNAVNYAVKKQDASGLTFGTKKQTQPPRIADDVKSLMSKGVDVYVVEDDVAERGLEKSELLEGLKTVNRAGLPKLFGEFERVWFW